MKPYPNPPEGLHVIHDAPVLRLVLDRPQRANSLTDEMVSALSETIEAAGSDEAVRAVLLSGTGENFCGGFDLAGRAHQGPRPRVGSIARRMPYQVNRLIPVLLETQVPIVCAAQGWAVGLGLALVLAADFAVVADDAGLRAPYTTMGITPDSGTSWLLPRLAGVARAKRMLLLGEAVSGATAADWGLVYAAVPAETLHTEAETLAQHLAASATVAVGLAKALVQRSGGRSLPEQLTEEAYAMELSSRTEDFRTWTAARREGDTPDFTGR